MLHVRAEVFVDKGCEKKGEEVVLGKETRGLG